MDEEVEIDELDDDEDELQAREVLVAVRAELTCTVCRNVFNDPIALFCGHAFCRDCVRGLIVEAHPQRARCPICRVPLRKHENEEAATCVPLRNAARHLVAAAAHGDKKRPPDVGDLVDAPSPHPPPRGWSRVQGFSNGLVVATRAVRREIDDNGDATESRLCLALRLPSDADKLLFNPDAQGTVYLETLGVAVLRMEDDEADEGIPLLLVDPDDDCLVARDQSLRHVVLDVPDGDQLVAPLEDGECLFEHVSLGLDGSWAVVIVADALAALEFKLAFRFFQGADRFDDEADDDEPPDVIEIDDEDEEEDEDKYDEDDGFVVADDEDEIIQVEEGSSPDDQSPDEQSPLPVERKRRRVLDDDDDDD